MNATNTQTTTTTVEQADALIEKCGMTEMVEDYEQNELGHVYQLTDNSRIVVTSPTTFQFFGAQEEQVEVEEKPIEGQALTEEEEREMEEEDARLTYNPFPAYLESTLTEAEEQVAWDAHQMGY